MFESREALERISRLEKRLSALAEVETAIRRINDDTEALSRRVRAVTAGDTLTVLAREIIDKIDRDTLVKEVVGILKAEVAARAKEDALEAICHRDLSDLVDQDHIEELLVEALVPKVKDSLPLKDLVGRVAEELLQGDHFDLREIEQGIVNEATERMVVTVSMSGK